MNTTVKEIKDKLIIPDKSFTSQWTQHACTLALQQKSIIRLRRGRYMPSDFYTSLEPSDQRIAQILAVQSSINSSFILSHQSAARIHDFAVLELENKTFFHCHTQQGKGAQDIKLYRYSQNISSQEILGMKVATAKQTVVDCLRELPALQALVVADSARYQGVRKDSILETAHEVRYKKSKILSALDFSTNLAESPGESICRFRFAQIGMPVPELQKVIIAEGARFRVDFAFEKLHLIVEFDGKVKYFKYTEDIKQTLYQEKVRQDILERNGWKVVRLRWQDLQDVRKFAGIFGRYIGKQ